MVSCNALMQNVKRVSAKHAAVLFSCDINRKHACESFLLSFYTVVGVKFIKVLQQLHMGDLDACSTCKIC